MEHSYARAVSGGGKISCAGTRLLLVRRAPRCPDCHTEGSHEDDVLDVDSVENVRRVCYLFLDVYSHRTDSATLQEPAPPLMLDEIPYWEKALVECDMIGEEEDLKPDWEEKLHRYCLHNSNII